MTQTLGTPTVPGGRDQNLISAHFLLHLNQGNRRRAKPAGKTDDSPEDAVGMPLTTAKEGALTARAARFVLAAESLVSIVN